MLGFVASIPVGAVQIEIAKRTLGNRIKQAVMVMLGSVTSDLLYGVVAFWGLAPLLENKKVLAVFSCAGAIILAMLAFIAFKSRGESAVFNRDSSLMRSKRLSYIVGLTIAIVNPIMVFWWLVGAKVVTDLNIVNDFTPKISLIFIIAGCLGLASYLTVLIAILHRLKTFVSKEIFHILNLSMAGLLVLLSAYFALSSLKTFIHL